MPAWGAAAVVPAAVASAQPLLQRLSGPRRDQHRHLRPLGVQDHVIEQGQVWALAGVDVEVDQRLARQLAPRRDCVLGHGHGGELHLGGVVGLVDELALRIIAGS